MKLSSLIKWQNSKLGLTRRKRYRNMPSSNFQLFDSVVSTEGGVENTYLI